MPIFVLLFRLLFLDLQHEHFNELDKKNIDRERKKVEGGGGGKNIIKTKA